MNELTLPFIFMLVFVVAEAVLLNLNGQHQIDWHDVIFNLNSGHIMLWLFRGLEVICFSAVLNSFSLGLFADTAPVWVWCFTLFAWDFAFYWLHRLHHQLRLLWAVHVVHHQGEHYNLSLGVRNSWYSSLTSIPFFITLAWLGVPLSVYLSMSIFHYTIQFFNHNALTPKLGFLEKIFVTPTHHRVHHINERTYADSNYGGTFIFWDKLFGTFKTLPQELHCYGVKGNPPTNNPFIESNRPFWRFLNRQSSPRQFKISSWMLFCGTIPLFALVLGYIHLYGYGYDNVSVPQIALFVLLAIGPVALGAISQGQYWGVVMWFALTLALLLLFVVALGWTQIFWVGTMSVLTLHGIGMLCGWGRQAVARSDI
ncbi:Fatty acid hydroxylase superfamily [Buttiauxella agrestis]|uniref:Fatty acid hydroxylase superfamily n=1 Tax=Buttiauxella agrestis TaxID=82977 RepID=A0A381CA60_9ENTR|nr:sterol desaturase family protein [Buttiauxella agrestis]SUW64788.1 Fatty acid hydroxylase superfamily [Buttiauxella agrestis]